MAATVEQIKGPQEDLRVSKTDTLDSVLNGNRVSQVRDEIEIIANRSFRQDIISQEVYTGYKMVAIGAEQEKMSLKILESTREFAAKHEERVLRIHQKISDARTAGFASEGDEQFLMKELDVKNFKFDEKGEWYEQRVDEKLAHMKKDKEKFNAFASHNLIKDIGYLKVDAGTRINFPKEEEFLAMTVPKRREKLKKLEEAMPKAEAYAEEHKEEKSQELISGYEAKLNKERKEGNIGEHTYNEFLKGIRSDKMDNAERDYWHEQFEAQMTPYRTLWKHIRGTLKGEALKNIEGQIDKKGHSGLFEEFGILKKSESKRLEGSYAVALGKYREEGVIGRHSMTSFMIWMNKQDLSDQYDAEGQLPDQIAPYETMWEKAGKLSKKEQGFMRSKIDIWGYTQLNTQLEAFESGKGILPDATPDPLSQIQSTEVRNAIAETDKILASQGTEKRRSFTNIIGKMFERVSASKFDATSFQAGVRSKVTDKSTEQPVKGREASNEVSLHQVKEDTKELEEAGRAKVTEETGFVQVESKEEGKTARQAQLTVNEEKGMKRFFTEEGKHSYQAEESGGNDDLSLAIKAGSGRTVELDLQETKVLHKYLKAKDEEQQLEKKT